MARLEFRDRASPNFGPRRDGLEPELIVLHHTAMADAQSALDRLCDSVAEVSSHYLIEQGGVIWRLVDEDMRAWHAGEGSWAGAGDVNSRSIGIELVNAGPLTTFPPFPEPQMSALEALLPAIMARHGIRPEGVIAHSDMAPGRKSDPGAAFDWQRLARAGLSIWPPDDLESDDDPATFRECCVALGYPLDASDETLLAAFRLRFHPGADGPVNARDLQRARNLARRFGVDPAPNAA